jgi:hypothetical protein
LRHTGVTIYGSIRIFQSVKAIGFAGALLQGKFNKRSSAIQLKLEIAKPASPQAPAQHV